MLAAELALEPAPETTALYERIRAGASFELKVLSSELKSRQLGTQSSELRTRRLGWSGAPEVQRFYGREAELATLRRWIVDERCRVISVLGMGGIGKTLLAAQLAHAVADQMDVVIWRSLWRLAPMARRSPAAAKMRRSGSGMSPMGRSPNDDGRSMV
jgi:hypothetical protein